MQVSTTYHASRAEKLGVSIYDEQGNIETAANYLRELFEEYEDAGLVLSIYHGESNAYTIYDAGRLSEYAETILNRSDELQKEYYGL